MNFEISTSKDATLQTQTSCNSFAQSTGIQTVISASNTIQETISTSSKDPTNSSTTESVIPPSTHADTTDKNAEFVPNTISRHETSIQDSFDADSELVSKLRGFVNSSINDLNAMNRDDSILMSTASKIEQNASGMDQSCPVDNSINNSHPINASSIESIQTNQVQDRNSPDQSSTGMYSTDAVAPISVSSLDTHLSANLSNDIKYSTTTTSAVNQPTSTISPTNLNSSSLTAVSNLESQPSITANVEPSTFSTTSTIVANQIYPAINYSMTDSLSTVQASTATTMTSVTSRLSSSTNVVNQHCASFSHENLLPSTSTTMTSLTHQPSSSTSIAMTSHADQPSSSTGTTMASHTDQPAGSNQSTSLANGQPEISTDPLATKITTESYSNISEVSTSSESSSSNVDTLQSENHTDLEPIVSHEHVESSLDDTTTDHSFVSTMAMTKISDVSNTKHDLKVLNQAGDDEGSTLEQHDEDSTLEQHDEDSTLEQHDKDSTLEQHDERFMNDDQLNDTSNEADDISAPFGTTDEDIPMSPEKDQLGTDLSLRRSKRKRSVPQYLQEDATDIEETENLEPVKRPRIRVNGSTALKATDDIALSDNEDEALTEADLMSFVTSGQTSYGSFIERDLNRSELQGPEHVGSGDAVVYRQTVEQNDTETVSGRKIPRSIYKGVCYVDRTTHCWQARICLQNKCRYIGVFANEEAAALAYDGTIRQANLNDRGVNFPLQSELNALSLPLMRQALQLKLARQKFVLSALQKAGTMQPSKGCSAIWIVEKLANYVQNATSNNNANGKSQWHINEDEWVQQHLRAGAGASAVATATITATITPSTLITTTTTSSRPTNETMDETTTDTLMSPSSEHEKDTNQTNNIPLRRSQRRRVARRHSDGASLEDMEESEHSDENTHVSTRQKGQQQTVLQNKNSTYQVNHVQKIEQTSTQTVSHSSAVSFAQPSAVSSGQVGTQQLQAVIIPASSLPGHTNTSGNTAVVAFLPVVSGAHGVSPVFHQLAGLNMIRSPIGSTQTMQTPSTDKSVPSTSLPSNSTKPTNFATNPTPIKPTVQPNLTTSVGPSYRPSLRRSFWDETESGVGVVPLSYAHSEAAKQFQRFYQANLQQTDTTKMQLQPNADGTISRGFFPQTQRVSHKSAVSSSDQISLTDHVGTDTTTHVTAMNNVIAEASSNTNSITATNGTSIADKQQSVISINSTGSGMANDLDAKSTGSGMANDLGANSTGSGMANDLGANSSCSSLSRDLGANSNSTSTVHPSTQFLDNTTSIKSELNHPTQIYSNKPIPDSEIFQHAFVYTPFANVLLDSKIAVSPITQVPPSGTHMQVGFGPYDPILEHGFGPSPTYKRLPPRPWTILPSNLTQTSVETNMSNQESSCSMTDTTVAHESSAVSNSSATSAVSNSSDTSPAVSNSANTPTISNSSDTQETTHIESASSSESKSASDDKETSLNHTSHKHIPKRLVGVRRGAHIKEVKDSEGSKSWYACVERANTTRWLGPFSTPEEAATVYDIVSLLMFGTSARTNYEYDLDTFFRREQELGAKEVTSLNNAVDKYYEQLLEHKQGRLKASCLQLAADFVPSVNGGIEQDDMIDTKNEVSKESEEKPIATLPTLDEISNCTTLEQLSKLFMQVWSYVKPRRTKQPYFGVSFSLNGSGRRQERVWTISIPTMSKDTNSPVIKSNKRFRCAMAAAMEVDQLLGSTAPCRNMNDAMRQQILRDFPEVNYDPIMMDIIDPHVVDQPTALVVHTLCANLRRFHVIRPWLSLTPTNPIVSNHTSASTNTTPKQEHVESEEDVENEEHMENEEHGEQRQQRSNEETTVHTADSVEWHGDDGDYTEGAIKRV